MINTILTTPTAKLPTYGSAGAACFDLYADTVERTHSGVTVDTGVIFEIPENHAMMIYSRSGMGFKNGIVLRNGTGVIDSDYRGTVKVFLTCHMGDLVSDWIDPSQMDALNSIEPGDRIAQAMIVPVQQVQFVAVDKLSETQRGTGGLGSSGK